MLVLLVAASLSRACDFCPRSSHQWRQNQGYQGLPTPMNVTEVQSFLGFMGYHHQFIRKFAQVAWPLHELTSGENAGKKKAAIKWDSRCQQAFNNLKRLCTMAPILAYADFTKTFKLYNDACGTGLGAVLYQTWEDGTEAVIAYTSRRLSKVKSHYPAHKLEFLTVKWAVVKKFHKYLYGSTFDVYTDNNCLTYMVMTVSWMQLVITGSPALQITFSGCTIKLEKPILMWMPCWGYPGLGAYLTIQALT